MLQTEEMMTHQQTFREMWETEYVPEDSGGAELLLLHTGRSQGRMFWSEQTVCRQCEHHRVRYICWLQKHVEDDVTPLHPEHMLRMQHATSLKRGR